MNHPLLSREVLLGLGGCLVMAGLVLRGLARDFRRDAERRRQHLRDERRSDDAGLGTQLERPPTWWEKNFGPLANVVLVAGVLIAIVALLRGQGVP